MLAIESSQIAQLIPHSGNMCLIEGVTRWDEYSIECITSTHRKLTNPLRNADRLSAICAIEYAAQAMAVHGALIAQNYVKPSFGYIASLRNMQFYVDYLDNIDGSLFMSCRRLMGDERSCMYEFSVLANEEVLVMGRASVVQSFGSQVK